MNKISSMILLKHLNLQYVFLMVWIAIVQSSCRLKTQESKGMNWEVYRGDDGVNASSSLEQINTRNVSKLEVAWTYRTGDNMGNSSIECNPLIIEGVLYGVSPGLKVFAVNAATGKEIWKFNPFKAISMCAAQ